MVQLDLEKKHTTRKKNVPNGDYVVSVGLQ
jgi:hypothetical protein